MRAGINPLTLLAVMAIAITHRAPAQGLPSFDAASIKPGSHPHTPEGYSYSYVKMEDPGRFRAVNANLHEYLQWAYILKDYQIEETDWLKSNTVTFDIDATAPVTTSEPQMRLMLQRLLAERFGVVLHHEMKPMPVYALTVNKGGPKLKPSTESTSAGVESRGSQSTIRMKSAAVTMSRLATALAGSLDRPVLDKTDLTGMFALDIAFARLTASDSDAPSVFAAMQTLGLKLEPVQAPIDIIKVDRANSTPTPN